MLCGQNKYQNDHHNKNCYAYDFIFHSAILLHNQGYVIFVDKLITIDC